MQNILLSFHGFENNSIFTRIDPNGSNNVWKLLKKRLAEKGYDLKTVDGNSLDTCARVIFVDETSVGNSTVDARNIYQECKEKGLLDKTILFLWEGPAVKPKNYSQELHDKFPVIFTWRDDLVDNKKFFKFHLPHPTPPEAPTEIKFQDKKFLVNISMNKLSSSPDELYSKRKKSIGFFDKNLGKEFDLYGYRWNTPVTPAEKVFPFLMKKFSSYRGSSTDKFGTLSRYKFALCYENCRGLYGYITEKIFDCFISKTVPIYWGAENVCDYVDSDAFIDRRNFPSDESLLNFLRNIDEISYSKYMQAASKYMRSEKHYLFTEEHFVTTVIDRLQLPMTQ